MEDKVPIDVMLLLESSSGTFKTVPYSTAPHASLAWAVPLPLSDFPTQKSISSFYLFSYKLQLKTYLIILSSSTRSQLYTVCWSLADTVSRVFVGCYPSYFLLVYINAKVRFQRFFFHLSVYQNQMLSV